jgi:hypothetical protein
MECAIVLNGKDYYFFLLKRCSFGGEGLPSRLLFLEEEFSVVSRQLSVKTNS